MVSRGLIEKKKKKGVPLTRRELKAKEQREKAPNKRSGPSYKNRRYEDR